MCWKRNVKAVKLDRQRVGGGSLSLLPRLTLAPSQRSALVGMKDACELARTLRLLSFGGRGGPEVRLTLGAVSVGRSSANEG